MYVNWCIVFVLIYADSFMTVFIISCFRNNISGGRRRCERRCVCSNGLIPVGVSPKDKWIESQVFWKCFGRCFESQVLRNYVPEVIILLYWHCFAQRTLSSSSRPLHLLSSSSESVQGTKYASLSHPRCAWDSRIRLLQTFSLGGLGHGRLFINSQKIDIVYGVAMSILLQFLSSSNVICLADGSTRMYTAQFVIT